jgi:hypothetical protein
MPVPSEEVVARLSAAIALLACALLYVEARASRRGTAPRSARAIALALAALAVTTYFHFFMIPKEQFFHRWELFHYFMGAKYAPELGYERLYACAAVADAESGRRAEVERRPMRDLRDDSLIEARAALRDPAACKQRFSAERWRVFRSDIGFFRRLAGSAEYWAEMQIDHGYNPSPVWTATGRAAASIAPLSRALVRGLALIDPALMLAAIVALGWAFGTRCACLAALFWATQAPSSFSWTGGAFLRQDWLLLCVLSMAFLRKQRPFAAGFCLAWAGLLRVFPLLLWAGPLLIALLELRRTRALSPSHKKLLAGGACAALLLLPIGAAGAGGPRQYVAFADHIAMHASTPIANHMSLRMLFSFEPNARFAVAQPVDEHASELDWGVARAARLERLRPLWWATLAALLIGFVHCAARLRTPWIALGLSAVLIVVLTDPSCYYHSFWILVAPLARARRVLELALLALAAASQLLALQLPFMDDRFTALSLLYVLFGVLLWALFSRRPGARAAVAERSRADGIGLAS